MNQPGNKTRAQKTAISILNMSIIVFVYFAVMILLNKLKYNFIITGVLRDMLTIPAFILLTVITAISLFTFIKQRFRINDMPFYALLIELVTIGLIIYIA